VEALKMVGWEAADQSRWTARSTSIDASGLSIPASNHSFAGHDAERKRLKNKAFSFILGCRPDFPHAVTFKA
jgi:hypothetical protein